MQRRLQQGVQPLTFSYRKLRGEKVLTQEGTGIKGDKQKGGVRSSQEEALDTV